MRSTQPIKCVPGCTCLGVKLLRSKQTIHIHLTPRFIYAAPILLIPLYACSALARTSPSGQMTGHYTQYCQVLVKCPPSAIMKRKCFGNCLTSCEEVEMHILHWAYQKLQILITFASHLSTTGHVTNPVSKIVICKTRNRQVQKSSKEHLVLEHITLSMSYPFQIPFPSQYYKQCKSLVPSYWKLVSVSPSRFH